MKKNIEKIDLSNFWNDGISYEEYKTVISKRAEKEKNSSDETVKKLADYTILNISRIKRNDKTIVLSPAIIEKLQSLPFKINILVISEGWCGDAAQSVPVINKIAEACEKIEMKLVFRDANENLINNYLTNGGKSIPIAILLNSKTFEEIGHWGPRPKSCLPFLIKYKENTNSYTHDDFAKDIQNFYNTNKGKDISEEIIQILSKK